MKNIYIITISLLILSISCQKEIIGDYAELKALNPQNIDENAGNWKPIVLTSATQVALPTPSDVNSSEYQIELQAMKTKMNNLTSDEREAITYWSGGSILRWNQIMRELVAKYNLPPLNNPDGTYPFPNADSTRNNPFYYPAFPFANPPYAARAFAYVSVAQYDALVAAYAYKKQFNRPTPYQVDNTIVPLVPSTNLAAYPCEDAVIASATLEVLKAMFPGESTYLTEKATEAKYFKLWAGAAVESDVVAGDSLGKAVAQLVIARAKTDGAKNAVANQVVWDSLANAVAIQGETPWVSLESPQRPPMLPLFGQVKTWLFDHDGLVAIRPSAPPKTNSAELKAALAEVKSYTDNPTRDNISLVHFWADGAGTHTPPGHWNAIAFDYIYNAQQSEVRMARNFALLNMALMDAAISCWDTKYYYFYPRPSQMDNSIKTLTGMPNFPSYTSGHSTFSAAAATLLGHLFPSEAANFEAMAQEASLSRLYGGIHYRMDCEKGIEAGNKIGNFAIQRAMIDGAE